MLCVLTLFGWVLCSMNLIAAHLIIQRGVDEEQAFWLLAQLLEICKGYHTPSMEGLACDLQVYTPAC